MASLTMHVDELEELGPVLPVRIGVASDLEQSFAASGASVPDPIQLTALIDTGASATVIRRGVASGLGLEPVGVTAIATASSARVWCDEYQVSLHLANGLVFETTAIEAPLDGHHIECLIGRDVLARSLFIFLGEARTFCLSA